MKNNGTNNIEDDVNLETEFAKIGFDCKTMLNNARHINPWIIFLSTEDTYINGTKIFFSFTVVRYGNSNHRSIHHITAALLKSVPNSNQTKILISKDYWDYNGPFPTKEKMYDDLIPIQTIKNTRKGFGPWNENFELN